MIGRKLDSIDLDTIIYGYLRGTPASEMAEVIGCHHSTITKHYRELSEVFGQRGRIGRGPYPMEVRRSALQRYHDGEGAISIAKDIGADRATIYYWLRKEKEGLV